MCTVNLTTRKSLEGRRPIRDSRVIHKINAFLLYQSAFSQRGVKIEPLSKRVKHKVVFYM